jgi:HAE1 family hydrophobic/amphiphilic exporter-1
LNIPIRNRAGAIVHVGDLATISNDPVAPLLTRVNRSTVVHVGANTAKGTAISQVQDRFKTELAALHLPSSVNVRPNAGGQQQNLGDTVNGLGAALLLAFALVYLLMVALYDSYRLPFIIMFSVPVASVGALGALAITGLTLNLFSLIGVVMLVGLVSKNGILLVDFANHRIRAGIDRVTAIRESARERFRPIVMTTISMIAGMTPIALALDPGSGVRQALGVVVIGGLTSSLVLTLILVPVAFVWLAPVHDKPSENLTEQERALVPQGVET